MKKFGKVLAAVTLIAAVLLSGCGGKKDGQASGSADDKKTIVYAKGMGPYTELFEDRIIPILEKKGYTFKVSELELTRQSPPAMWMYQSNSIRRSWMHTIRMQAAIW